MGSNTRNPQDGVVKDAARASLDFQNHRPLGFRSEHSAASRNRDGIFTTHMDIEGSTAESEGGLVTCWVGQNPQDRLRSLLQEKLSTQSR
ncbi:hypothetical protein PM082_002370 [Marasmius tenuissimus]|nr:hypothetical protein PM082_002370 [Marasmius tenuissimus]